MNASSPSHRNPADSPALRIAILYVVIGVIWILLSDRVADLLAPAPATVSRLQTTKGWFFVVGSGIFFYVLIEHYWKTAAHSRSAAERAERRLSALVRSLPGMVYRRRMGTDPAMEYVSEACRAITGRAPEDFVEGGLNWNDLVVEEDRPDVERIQRHALERRVPFVVNYRLQAAGGGEKWVSEHGVGVYGPGGLEAVEGYVSDITEHKRYERQMFQAEKMNAVGRMAAGVAHDLNNVLFAIMGLSELLAPILPSGSKEAEYVGEIHAAGERAAKLVRQLLTIARRQPARVEIVDLNLLVGNLATFLERITGKAVNLSTRVAQSPARVKADPGQVEQVLMNLAINARDAMPEGGKLDISVDVIHLDEDEAFSQLDLQPGDYAVLGVSDTGCGMDKETLARVFEPFFTTKPPERGTGLGLTTTYGIVRQYGGAIHVYSEPGRGTTFRVYLPLTPEMEEAAKAAAAPAPQPGGTVLVVDDEEAVLRVVGAMLEEMGFAVLTAKNAEAALECCRQQSPRLTLIVTDLVLPGLSGWDLATRLRRDYLHTPVLFMSGFANNMIFRDAEMGPLESYLEKPITPRALKEKVNELLGRASR